MSLDKDYSGNLKLRVPKSLHKSLVEQAVIEGVSLNQYCMMLLCKGRYSTYLGSYEFDELLGNICPVTLSNWNKLFDKLYNLNTQVEGLRSLLIEDIQRYLESGKNDIEMLADILKPVYPIISGSAFGEKYPLLKIPSAKIVLQTTPECFVSEETIKGLWEENELLEKNLDVSWGDFDLFQPYIVRKKSINERSIRSMVITISSDFSELDSTVNEVISLLSQNDILEGVDVCIKPSYLCDRLDIGNVYQ